MAQLLYKLSPALLRPEFREHPEKTCRIIVEMADPRTDRILSFVEAKEGKGDN